MFKCFVEDSGKDGVSPKLVLAAWVARCDDWERFSDAWQLSLEAGNPKPLKPDHKGRQYFKHYDAKQLSGCFDGFTGPEETALKALNLAHLFIGIPVIGFIVTVDQKLHKKVVQDGAIREKRRLRPELADALAVALAHLIPLVHTFYHRSGVRDRIDIIVDGDGTDAAANVVMSAFRKARNDARMSEWHDLMGGLSFVDDKELAPLQAADFLAGEKRDSTISGIESALISFLKQNRVLIVDFEINADLLDTWRSKYNEDASTRKLIKAKNEEEVTNGGKINGRVRRVRRGDTRITSGPAQRTTKKTGRRKASKGQT